MRSQTNLTATLTITFTLICGLVLCQQKERLDFESCDDAIHQANVDADAGILTSVSWGMRPLKDLEGDTFRQNLMLAKYGIESLSFGCVIPSHLDCYGNQMHEIILAKFGSDFFEKIEKEYDVFKDLEHDEKKKYIDFDNVYKRVDKRAQYSKGLEELRREIHEQVSLPALDSAGHKLIGLRLVVGPLGTIDECKILSIGLLSAKMEEVENAIRKLGGWTPATLYGFNVKSEVIIAIPLRLE